MCAAGLTSWAGDIGVVMMCFMFVVRGFTVGNGVVAVVTVAVDDVVVVVAKETILLSAARVLAWLTLSDAWEPARAAAWAGVARMEVPWTSCGRPRWLIATAPRSWAATAPVFTVLATGRSALACTVITETTMNTKFRFLITINFCSCLLKYLTASTQRFP